MSRISIPSTVTWHRSSRPKVLIIKSVLRNFRKKFNKIAGLRAATLLKKRLWHRCFPMNLANFFRTPFVTEQRLCTSYKGFLLNKTFKAVTKLVINSKSHFSLENFRGCLSKTSPHDYEGECTFD